MFVDCFITCLFRYDLLHPDVIMELAWKHKIMDLAMPYMIQTMRDTQQRIEKLELAEKSRKEEVHEAAAGGPDGMMHCTLICVLR